MNTIKNCHSPAGMGFYSSRTSRFDKDCPKCKYGTLVPWTDRDRKVLGERCIDCGAMFPARAKPKPNP